MGLNSLNLPNPLSNGKKLSEEEAEDYLKTTILRLENKYTQYAPYSLLSNFTSENSTSDNILEGQVDARLTYAKLRIATALTFWCGLIQVLF